MSDSQILSTRPTSEKSALVLFSGGQDSATCLAWALERYARVETVGFDYGQRHAVEMQARLAVRDGMEMVIIEACRPRSSMLTARLDVGSRAPLPVSALGRAFLSAIDDAQRQQLIDSLRLLRGPEWDSVAPAMHRSIDEARRLGYLRHHGQLRNRQPRAGGAPHCHGAQGATD